MKVLADVGPIYNGQPTGIGYFTDELLKHLSKQVDLRGYAFNFRGKKHIKLDFPVEEQKVLPGKSLTYPRYLKLDIPLSVFFKTKGYDVVLGTNFLVPPCGRIPAIPFIHDLNFIDHPEWAQSRNAHVLQTMLPKTLRRSSAIVTISEFSAQRIQDIYNYKKPILVIGIPPKKSLTKPLKPKDNRLKSGKFFLFVGTIEPRKNIRTLFDAYDALPTEMQSEFKLVLAGKPGWDNEIVHRLKSDTNKNIIYLDYVSEAERNWLYVNSVATILSSHYEGFGMTILEALDSGSPTITSDIPPHREILGDKGSFFDCLDTVTLTKLLNNFTNLGFRNQAYLKQRKVLEDYSWQKTTAEVYGFICNVVARNKSY